MTSGRSGASGLLLRRLALVAVGVLVTFGASGCADDEGDSGVSADAGSADAACSPVGENLEAGSTKVPVRLQEYSFSPDQVAVGAGVVTFAAENVGRENHELAFFPGGGEVPLNREGDPDEDALGAAGAFELEAFGAGKRCNATYDLKPGTYAMFCIVTAADGQTHYAKGMRGQLVVA